MPRSIEQIGTYTDVPFRIKPIASGDIRPTNSLVSIRQSIFNILNTNPGERTLNPDFGCNIRQFLFEPFDKKTANRIGQEIKTALIDYERRIRLIKVRIRLNHANASYTIRIIYTIPPLSMNDNITVELQRL